MRNPDERIGGLKKIVSAERDLQPAAAFLRDRFDWLEVRAVHNEEAKGWDIALIIDGTYFDDQEVPPDMVQYFERWLAEVLQKEGVAQ